MRCTSCRKTPYHHHHHHHHPHQHQHAVYLESDWVILAQAAQPDRPVFLGREELPGRLTATLPVHFSVCVLVWVSVSVCVCVQPCLCVFVWVNVCVCLCVCASVCLCMRIRGCVQSCVYYVQGCHLWGPTPIKLFTLSKSLTERESGHQIFLPEMTFFVNIFRPDHYSLSEILSIFKTNVYTCPWPDYNVPASAFGMFLSP